MRDTNIVCTIEYSEFWRYEQELAKKTQIDEENLEGGLFYNLANCWNDFKASIFFKSIDDISMGIISVSDHWSDITVIYDNDM